MKKILEFKGRSWKEFFKCQTPTNFVHNETTHKMIEQLIYQNVDKVKKKQSDKVCFPK